jgi:hypothetical protein
MERALASDEQLTKYIERARRHVELGRLQIERLKKMVEGHRVEGRDSKPAEDLLAAFERSQRVFEHDLARLIEHDLTRLKRVER